MNNNWYPKLNRDGAISSSTFYKQCGSSITISRFNEKGKFLSCNGYENVSDSSCDRLMKLTQAGIKRGNAMVEDFDGDSTYFRIELPKGDENETSND